MFIPNPVIQQIGSSRNYRLIMDYKARIYRNVYLLIAKKFVYDGASIPFWLWWLLGSPFDYSFAIIHDALYKSKLLPRHKADWIFLKVCKVKGVSWWRRWLIYIGLRLFGWVTWICKSKYSVLKAQKYVALEIII